LCGCSRRGRSPAARGRGFPTDTGGARVLIHTLAIGDAITFRLPDGRPVRVVYAGHSQGKARLAVEADRSVGVYRAEMLGENDPRKAVGRGG
jgi:sRNA-binding carbon storage regulator CsrA